MYFRSRKRIMRPARVPRYDGIVFNAAGTHSPCWDILSSAL